MSRSFTLPGGIRLVGEILAQPLEPRQRRAWEWLAWHHGTLGGSTQDAIAVAPLKSAVVYAMVTLEAFASASPSPTPAPSATPVGSPSSRVVLAARAVGAWLRRALCSSGLRVWT